MTGKELGKIFPVIISEPDSRWLQKFAEERMVLIKEFGNDFFLSIEHIGSTAVPNLRSKPIVDILCEIREDTGLDNLKERFETLGYRINNRPENPPPHLIFVKGYSSEGFQGQVFHVHIRYKGDWDERYFRDYLIRNRKTALEYEELKKELAVKYRTDREAYTEAKTDFIKSVVKLARKREL